MRSLLFAPANRTDLIGKFPRYAADAFAIDLEDGVPEASKASARRDLPRIVDGLRQQSLKGKLFVRTNQARSQHFQPDFAAALDTPIDGIIVPKLETAGDLHAFASVSHRKIEIIGLIETAKGVQNVETLAGSEGANLCALAFGAEDFMTDIGGRRTAEGLEVLYARSRVVLAAKGAGFLALDQVFVDIRNDEAFRRDAEFGRQLGYNGKMCVTPRQVEIANEVFSPSTAEIERCRRLIEAYETARAEGRGAIEFEGSMVDEPLLKRARAIVESDDIRGRLPKLPT